MGELTRSIRFTDDRWLLALKRMLALVKGDTRLKFIDSTQTGNKFTECSWGMCTDARRAWPDAQDHLWPDEFVKHGRVAPLYRESWQKCPLDRRRTMPDTDKRKFDSNGCFYTCAVFQANRANPAPTREQTIELYQLTIAETEARMNAD